MRSYRLGQFGQVYPLARGTSPLLVAITAAVLVGEPLPGVQLAGVLTVSAGLASLVLAGGLPSRTSLPAITAAVATGVMIATYTTVDGLGVYDEPARSRLHRLAVPAPRAGTSPHRPSPCAAGACPRRSDHT